MSSHQEGQQESSKPTSLLSWAPSIRQPSLLSWAPSSSPALIDMWTLMLFLAIKKAQAKKINSGVKKDIKDPLPKFSSAKSQGQSSQDKDSSTLPSDHPTPSKSLGQQSKTSSFAPLNTTVMVTPPSKTTHPSHFSNENSTINEIEMRHPAATSLVVPRSDCTEFKIPSQNQDKIDLFEILCSASPQKPSSPNSTNSSHHVFPSIEPPIPATTTLPTETSSCEVPIRELLSFSAKSTELLCSLLFDVEVGGSQLMFTPEMISTKFHLLEDVLAQTKLMGLLMFGPHHLQ